MIILAVDTSILVKPKIEVDTKTSAFDPNSITECLSLQRMQPK